MAEKSGVKIILGSSIIAGGDAMIVADWLDTVERMGIRNIDTAPMYGSAEVNLGKANAATRFTISTKCSTHSSNTPSTKDVVVESGHESMRKLRTQSVDIYYLHAPDRRLPFEETLEGVNELYKEGLFKRFGLSNFLAHEVEEVVRIAKERDFVLPSVYQGNYSAVTRRMETELLPTLRKHGIAFYAYSPIAAGFLAQTEANLFSSPRWDITRPGGKVNHLMYNKPSYLKALGVWRQTAQEEGVSQAELAYRWVAYHSPLSGDFGDGLIIGTRNEEQLRETLDGIRKGPFSMSAARKIDGIWKIIEADAPLDTVNVSTLTKEVQREKEPDTYPTK
ncbi:NADP-dependent oxidoreductase domain-containing protein [Xylariaceae sp. FL1651]|nr:NADP-dependent oxidoreductase domain-containing protein [Xylariaceae sp. FL1651]